MPAGQPAPKNVPHIPVCSTNFSTHSLIQAGSKALIPITNPLIKILGRIHLINFVILIFFLVYYYIIIIFYITLAKYRESIPPPRIAHMPLISFRFGLFLGIATLFSRC